MSQYYKIITSTHHVRVHIFGGNPVIVLVPRKQIDPLGLKQEDLSGEPHVTRKKVEMKAKEEIGK